MLTRRRTGRRAVASLEFAFVAPIMLTLTLSCVDAARAYLIWAQIHEAANAIAEAAAKLSVTTNPTTGAITSQLTADQMQQAMSVVFAEIPQLNLGNQTGLFPDSIAVVLSSISYKPLCAATTNCGSQLPYVVWSSYLSVGGPAIYQGYKRPCGYLQPEAQFLDNNGNINEMASPVVAGGKAMTLTPQLVADVVYSFHPFFPLFLGGVQTQTQLVATATMPVPIGGLTQVATFNPSGSTVNLQCSPIPPS
jgi:Flp pilus assembly protein TadG